MDSLNYAALQQKNIRGFWAAMIELPDTTLYLTDGSGIVKFTVDGIERTFKSRDPVFGILGNMTNISESTASNAPSQTITILPEHNEAIAAIGAVDAQGSRVRVWTGVKDDATGLVIGEPDRKFKGFVNTIKETSGANARAVDIECITVFDRLFLQKEGQRLTLTYQQSIYPIETGLKATATSTDTTFYWGGKGTVASAVTLNVRKI